MLRYCGANDSITKSIVSLTDAMYEMGGMQNLDLDTVEVNAMVCLNLLFSLEVMAVVNTNPTFPWYIIQSCVH